MPSSRPPRIVLALALALAGAVGWGAPRLEAAAVGDSHNFQTVGCTHCHLAVPGQSALVRKLVFRKDISELCRECHEDSAANQVNHRIGIIPSMRVPDDLHLGARGELTCITCHQPHMPRKNKATGNRTYYLRRGILKRELCLACHHEEKFGEPTTTIRLITPPEAALVATMPIPLIGTVSDDLVTEVMLFVNGLPVRLEVKDRAFSTLLTSLSEGQNALRVEAKRARTAEMTLIYSPENTDKQSYRLYYSHGIQRKADCRLCHAGDGGRRPAGPDRDLCLKCHQTRSSMRYLHGPVASGSCTVCHDPHGETNRYFLRAQGEKLCFLCHSEKEVLLHFIEKSADDTSLLKSRGCGFCHDPHQSNRKYLLRKS